MGFYRVASALLVMNLVIAIMFSAVSAYFSQTTSSVDTVNQGEINSLVTNAEKAGTDQLGGFNILTGIFKNFLTMNYPLWRALGLDNVQLVYSENEHTGINLAAAISAFQGIVIALAFIEYLRGRY